MVGGNLQGLDQLIDFIGHIRNLRDFFIERQLEISYSEQYDQMSTLRFFPTQR